MRNEIEELRKMNEKLCEAIIKSQSSGSIVNGVDSNIIDDMKKSTMKSNKWLLESLIREDTIHFNKGLFIQGALTPCTTFVYPMLPNLTSLKSPRSSWVSKFYSMRESSLVYRSSPCSSFDSLFLFSLRLSWLVLDRLFASSCDYIKESERRMLGLDDTWPV